MAGDWIKMEKDTPDKPEVLALATLLGISVGDAFLACFRVWRWADSQTSDGYVRRVTVERLDELSGIQGFGQALSEVGWLHVRNGALQLPNFGRHMGQSAKNRALTADRMARSRCDKSDAHGVTKPSPEKRREENTPLTPRGGNGEKIEFPPSLDTPAFRAAWAEWEQHRRETKHALKPTTVKHQMKLLGKLSPEHAAEVIRVSIEKGWVGLFPEKVPRPTPARPPADEQLAKDRAESARLHSEAARGAAPLTDSIKDLLDGLS
jgi:hypothetical protein